VNRQFPALRGLAILLVILNHSVTLSLQHAAEFGFQRAGGIERYLLISLKELGVIAVPIFLFLSGTFLVYAAQGKDLKTAYKITISGLRHIVWPYLLWSVVFYIVMFFIKGERSTPLEYMMKLLTGYPYNFVPLLVFFYLLSPLIVWVARRWPWLVAMGFGLYQLFLIVVLQQEALGLALPGWLMYLTPPIVRITFAVWGIFFPLGILYGLYSRAFVAVLQKVWPVLLGITLIFYVVAVLDLTGIVSFPLAEVFLPAAGILLIPLIRRDTIPFAPFLERTGKRSYGLYLTNLTIINLVLFSLRVIFPGLLNIHLLVVPLLFCAALFIPSAIMHATERIPAGRMAFRYVFG
jgi:peptidoglycan/LPS O-acetylase OafA/YrhL